MKIPDQGDIIVLDFDPQAGHEQMKRRPALVLSPDWRARRAWIATSVPAAILAAAREIVADIIN